MRKIIRVIFWAIAVLLIVIVIKAVTFKSKQISVWQTASPPVGIEAAERLAGAIRIPTVSYEVDMPVDTTAFRELHNYLAKTFPLIHTLMKPLVFNEFSLLYKWPGSNPALKPVVLMAHMDVVPPGDENLWTKPPFSGEIDARYIWGRGTLDDKGALMQIMEAVEKLISEGFVPARTFYLSFGHDEELSGMLGANTIASYLAQQGVIAEYVADEGMALTMGMVPMMSKPVALIGTSEKGYLSVRLSVMMDGGHSSTPGTESALTVIADAVSKLNKKQMKPSVAGPVDDFIRYIGPEMPFYARLIFANKWLFRPLLIKIYTGSSSGNALVRTTTAATVISAGVKDNVIPVTASAVVNFRILAGESSDDVLAHIKKVVNDERVSIEILPGLSEPAAVSPVTTYGFSTMLKTIRQVYPEAVVSPTLMLASSDSKHFEKVSSNIYRFAPMIVTSDDMARIHGIDERVPVENYLRGITYYYYLIRNSNDEQME